MSQLLNLKQLRIKVRDQSSSPQICNVKNFRIIAWNPSPPSRGRVYFSTLEFTLTCFCYRTLANVGGGGSTSVRGLAVLLLPRTPWLSLCEDAWASLLGNKTHLASCFYCLNSQSNNNRTISWCRHELNWHQLSPPGPEGPPNQPTESWAK